MWEPGGISASKRLAPVVFVHGFAQRAESWDAVAREVAVRTGRAAAAIDLVGHGGADRPDDPQAYGLAAQGRAVVAFARELNDAAGKGVPVLVGYSMGGRVALAALAADPRAFSAVVLESAGIGPVDEAERAALAERNAQWAARVRAEGADVFMEWWADLPLFASQRSLPAAVRGALRASRVANDAEALACTFEHAGAHAMPPAHEAIDLLNRFAAAGARVAYFAGALDEKYAAVAHRIAADVPHATVRIIDAAGHNTHLERPHAFARALLGIVS